MTFSTRYKAGCMTDDDMQSFESPSSLTKIKLFTGNRELRGKSNKSIKTIFCDIFVIFFTIFFAIELNNRFKKSIK